MFTQSKSYQEVSPAFVLDCVRSYPTTGANVWARWCESHASFEVMVSALPDGNAVMVRFPNDGSEPECWDIVGSWDGAVDRFSEVDAMEIVGEVAHGSSRFNMEVCLTQFI